MHSTDNRVDRKLDDIRAFIGEVYGGTLHAKRVNSLAGATLGIMEGASLAMAAEQGITDPTWLAQLDRATAVMTGDGVREPRNRRVVVQAVGTGAPEVVVVGAEDMPGLESSLW